MIQVIAIMHSPSTRKSHFCPHTCAHAHARARTHTHTLKTRGLYYQFLFTNSYKNILYSFQLAVTFHLNQWCGYCQAVNQYTCHHKIHPLYCP
jgi:hypothetical protein